MRVALYTARAAQAAVYRRLLARLHVSSDGLEPGIDLIESLLENGLAKTRAPGGCFKGEDFEALEFRVAELQRQWEESSDCEFQSLPDTT